MICGAGLFRPRRIMMIPAPTVAAPAPMRALFGSLGRAPAEDSDTLASWLPGPCARATGPALRSSSRRQRPSGRFHPPRHAAATSLDAERLASPTRRATIPYRPGVADRTATGCRAGTGEQTTQSGSHECGHLAKKGSRGYSEAYRVWLLLPPAVQARLEHDGPASARRVSNTSSRERQTCDRESTPFTSST